MPCRAGESRRSRRPRPRRRSSGHGDPTPALVLLDMNVRGARTPARRVPRRGPAPGRSQRRRGERVRALEAGCVDALPQSLEPDELALKVTRLARSDQVQRRWDDRRRSSDGRSLRLPARVEGRGADGVSPCCLGSPRISPIAAGRLTPARTLLQDVWGEPWADPNKVHQAMYRLRRRLGEPADSPFLVAQARSRVRRVSADVRVSTPRVS